MAARPDDAVAVLPARTSPRTAGVTLAELLSSFYLWVLLWLVAWVAIPALALGWQPVLITSGSMGPTISPGDLVLISPHPEDGFLDQGTVITYRDRGRGDALVTHRIDGVREDGLYRTRGDANESPDDTPVRPDDVVGQGRLLVPLVGLPLLWLRTDLLALGLFSLGTLAAVVVAGASHRAGERAAAGTPDAEVDGDVGAGG